MASSSHSPQLPPLLKTPELRSLARQELITLRSLLDSSTFTRDGFVQSSLAVTCNNLRRELDEIEKNLQVKSGGNNSILSALPSSSSSSSSSLEGIERISTCRVAPKSINEAICMLLHAFLLDEGFVCIVEGQSSVPGFAPPLRELAKGQFLPDNWQQQQQNGTNVVTIMYKHKIKPGKNFSLTCVSLNANNIVVTLSERGGGSFSTEVTTPQFTNTGVISQENDGAGGDLDAATMTYDISALYTNVEVLKELFKALVTQVCPQLKSSPSPSSLGISSASVENVSNRTDIETSSSLLPLPSRTIYPPSQIPRIGGGDLLPYPGLLDPYPQPGWLGQGQGQGQGQGIGGYAGNEVGPRHPFFAPEAGVFPDGNGFLPQPRFDPYGPVTGPHGPNFGNPGVGRGFPQPQPQPMPFPGGRGDGRGGRGRGRGRSTPPGEPTPDHLRPPGWDFDDNMYM